jgi:hypothetical protein
MFLVLYRRIAMQLIRKIERHKVSSYVDSKGVVWERHELYERIEVGQPKLGDRVVRAKGSELVPFSPKTQN